VSVNCPLVYEATPQARFAGNPNPSHRPPLDENNFSKAPIREKNIP